MINLLIGFHVDLHEPEFYPLQIVLVFFQCYETIIAFQLTLIENKSYEDLFKL